MILKLKCICLFMMSIALHSQNSSQIISSLETISIETGERKIIFQDTLHFEAPNWSVDGAFFIINSKGKLYKIDKLNPKMELIQIEGIRAANNDHGISFDGKELAISNNNGGENNNESQIYISSIKGGKPKLITSKTPSYWHGWSPDGKTLVYCAERNEQYDVYSISSEGGKEIQLTNTEGLDDGPEYSPDGKYIYFNSYRSGNMHIWRMDSDGKNKKQLTFDNLSNWFPHPSPDGKWIVFISYLENQKSQHPADKECVLRLMNLETDEIKELTKVFGGQGTINVPSWSPDSKQIAFVSYNKR